MVKHTFAFIAVALVSAQAYAAPTVRTMYTTALAREEALRPRLASPAASPATLRDARAIVSAYEAVVRRYPASSYSDNALWQAGRLALDAFERFGQVQDRDLGVRLLRRLATSYPSSKLARQVSSRISRLDAAPPTADAARAPAESARVAHDSNDRASEARPASTTSTAGVEPAHGRVATVRDIRRVVLPDAVRITIDLDVEVPFHDERIPDPARVFLDLPSTRAAPSLVDHTMRFDGDMDIVRQIRIGRHPNNTTRIVLDAAGVSSYSVYPLYGPYRLVIDCLRAKPAAPAAKPALALAGASLALLPARGLTTDWERRLPSAFPTRKSTLIREALLDAAAAPAIVSTPATASASIPSEPLLPSVPPSAPPAATSPPPPKSLPGGFSMARQLGLGVSRIVIDPGHGGHDPGAQGKGVNEADLVLDVALRLEKLLTAVPGVEVILTRRTDEFIPLPERTAIANREGADLFLSIHANASTSAQARGIETYFLNFASNLSAASVAARENAASGQAMGALPDIVKAIALNNKLDESRDFATQVQHAMMEKLRGQNKALRDLGVKQAPFVVLIGAAMPSVLAEISFVTNPQEARLLKSGAYRQKIAEALYGAVRKYQTSLKSAMAVAQQ